MKQWKYIKGSADDFTGAPDWAIYKIKCPFDVNFVSGLSTGSLAVDVQYPEREPLELNGHVRKDIIAERTPIPDETTANKYARSCKGVTIDVYDVLQAFNVTNPALQHLVKKALCAGLRGHKDRQQDLQEIIDSANRAIELEKE